MQAKGCKGRRIDDFEKAKKKDAKAKGLLSRKE